MNPFISQVEVVKDSWREDALCTQMDPDMFFPPRGSTGEEAKAVCKLCPVVTECLKFALDNHELYGVWGGMNEHERRATKRTLPPTPSHRCGTPSGADRHYRRNELVCWECRKASRDESRRRRAARGIA